MPRRTRSILVASALAVPLLGLATLWCLSPALRARTWLRFFDWGVISEESAHKHLVSIGRPSESAILVWLEKTENERLGLFALGHIPDGQRWLEAMVVVVAKGSMGFNSPFLLPLQERAKADDARRLLELLEHPDDHVKVLAINMLTRLPVFCTASDAGNALALPVPAPGIKPALVTLVGAADTSSSVRKEAQLGLEFTSYGGSEGIRTIREMLGSADPATSLRAVAVIGEKGGNMWPGPLLGRLRLYPPGQTSERLRAAIQRVLRERYRDAPRVRDVIGGGSPGGTH